MRCDMKLNFGRCENNKKKKGPLSVKFKNLNKKKTKQEKFFVFT